MTFDLVVTLVLSVFLVLVTIDRQHDANRVLYVKAVWPRPVLGIRPGPLLLSRNTLCLLSQKYKDAR